MSAVVFSALSDGFTVCAADWARLWLIQRRVRSALGSGQTSQLSLNCSLISHTAASWWLENEPLKRKNTKPNKCQVKQRLVTVLLVLAGLRFSCKTVGTDVTLLYFIKPTLWNENCCNVHRCFRPKHRRWSNNHQKTSSVYNL